MKIMVVIVPLSASITLMLPIFSPQPSYYVIACKFFMVHFSEGEETKVALLLLFLTNYC